MDEVRKRGRRPKKEGTINYFDEDNFRNVILPKIQANAALPNSFVKDIFSITDGMINTEFRNNTFVLENREDLKHECFFEVLKSLKKFKCEKGRSFAYFNRIIKNTLLKWYYKNLKVQTKELKLIDMTIDYDNGEDFNYDDSMTVLNSKIKLEEESTEQNSVYFYPVFDADASKTNKLEKRNQDTRLVELSVHRYLEKLILCINNILTDTDKRTKFLEYIKYNDKIDDAFSDENSEDIVLVLNEANDLFTACDTKIKEKIESEPDKYNFSTTNKILVNNKVLVYIKNEISSRKMRKSCKLINKNPKLAAAMISLLMTFSANLEQAA